MKHRVFRSVLPVLLLLCTSVNLHAKTTVYGLSAIHSLNRHAKAPFYLQIGAFKTLSAAKRVKSQYMTYGFPIHIIQHGMMQAVIMGPIPTRQQLPQSGVRAQPLKQYEHKHARTHTPVNQATDPNWLTLGTREPHTKRTVYSTKDPSYAIPPDETKAWFLLEEDHWYITGEGGMAFPMLNTNMTVPNGSSYPSPYDVDQYSTSKNNQGLIAISAGKRWKTCLPYLNRLALGLRYQYLFSRNVGGTIMQYSMPEFLNYDYNWNISANTFTAETKLNLFEYNNFSPYLSGGLGVTLNQTQAYTETAISPVTARISPGFRNQSKGQFTYHGGAGLDYRLKEQWVVSLGYEYEQLGGFTSGAGLSTWSSESLSLGQYGANTARLGLTYLTN